ncbi:TerC family protein [Metallumcola ferriviriculae]|uniref:TerC family protein n=1 Tax=Metallumcola ferriviriculae TaxID=3039180 RepID=A0AAU0UN14_9FIRM|nr:TerC family protein [Desulfitibacteraceae bacterium MK1]
MHLSTLLGPIFSIILINLVLSGDNAAVIGLAIKDLSEDNRKKAAIIGAGGAVLLRVILTVIAGVLITIPYLEFIGGVILIGITWSLISGNNDEANVKSDTTMWGAITTIIIADLTMSFDNVMGIAGAANGNTLLLILGLLISIPIVVFGSNLLAKVMNRYPVIIYIGGAILAHTSIDMILKDHGLDLTHYLNHTTTMAVSWGIALVVLLWGWMQVRQASGEES